MNKNQIGAMVLIAGILGYFIGVNFPLGKKIDNLPNQQGFKNQNENQLNNQGRTNSQRLGQRSGGANNASGLRPVNGEIIAVDDKSITVKLQNDTSKIILLDSKSSINKTATATVADLKIGEKIAAFGTENSDGSLTAQNVQLNPALKEGVNKELK